MDSYYQGVTYSVDLVFCIDATASMIPVIDNVKNGALQFNKDLNALMKGKGKVIDHLRIKVIVFRDYYVDGDASYLESAFFTLPEQASDYSAFVSNISAHGGGDEPECGLEAIDQAIRSDWNKEGSKRRQIIVVYSDASAHKLEKQATKKPANYPSIVAKSYDELTDLWEGQYHVNESFKRLLLFTPEAFPWTNINNDWNNSIHYPSNAGAGLSDVHYDEILQAIANSV